MGEHCNTCRYWAHEKSRTAFVVKPGYTEDDAGLGGTERAREYLKLGLCAAVQHGNTGGPVRRGSLAVVMDGSGYSASLWTCSEFGCVLHEEKQP